MVVALGAVIGLGVAAASPPPTAAFDDFDGRTWLAVPRAEGSQLLLVNGISGSLEAEAVVAPAPASVTFAGADSRRTLLRTPDSLVIVDNATHAVVRRPLETDARVALVGDDVLVVWEDVTRLPSGSEVGSRVVAGAPSPVPDAPVVVDGRGQPWYLAQQNDGGVFAVAVDGADDGGLRVVPVSRSTRSLLVVDGRVHALGEALVAVEGERTSSRATEGLLPSVAEGAKGTWATASSSTLSVFRKGKAETTDLGAEITALAVWHGSVYAVTPSGVTAVGRDGLEPLPEIGGGAALHVDGGLLWLTTPEAAMAIDPDQGRVVLRLASADLSLCVGDCSAAAASTFLDQVASDAPSPPEPPAKPATGDPSPTTTEAPRVLEAASVTPTLPTTTVPRAATSAPPTTARPATATPPPPNPAPVPDVVPEPIPPTAAPSSSTTTTAPKDNGKDKENPVPATLPRPIDPRPTTTTTTTTTTAPPSTAEPEPEPEPEPPVELEYSLRAGRGSATADIRVLGRPSACGALGTATTGTVSWTGSATGSREVLITWPQPDSRRSHETSATIVAPPGELRVTVTVCGVAATQGTTIEGDPVTTTTTTTTAPTTTTTPPTTTTTVPTTTTLPSTTVPPVTTTTAPGSTTTTTTTIRPTTTTSPPTTTTPAP